MSSSSQVCFAVLKMWNGEDESDQPMEEPQSMEDPQPTELPSRSYAQSTAKRLQTLSKQLDLLKIHCEDPDNFRAILDHARGKRTRASLVICS